MLMRVVFKKKKKKVHVFFLTFIDVDFNNKKREKKYLQSVRFLV